MTRFGVTCKSSTLSLSVGVHVRVGGSEGQGAAAEQIRLTEVPSITFTVAGLRVGLDGFSEGVIILLHEQCIKYSRVQTCNLK